MSNVAKRIIWPTNPDVLVRVVILHVGQGASAIVLIADGSAYKSLLVDINLDAKNDGIDVPKLMADLLDNSDLDVFVNTHPHSDHLSGIKELSDAVNINAVWHSGHKPGKKHDDAHKNLLKLIKEVSDNGGTIEELKGSRSPIQIGEAECYMLAPAEYVVDDIDDETEEERKRRIHEQCAVLKFGLGSTWITLTGDADRDAWEKHITNYHGERLNTSILEAAHHGSRTFFCYKEDDEPYMDALEKIAPTYVVVSAPRRNESEYGHPHEDAMAWYSEAIGEDNVLHTGDKRHSFICDIYRDGEFSVQSDNGDLVDNYAIEDDNNENGKKVAASAISYTRIDHRAMGSSKE